jgi:hypothetical protein
MLSKFVQPKNASLSIEDTFAGITIDFRFLQLPNALSLTLSIDDGKFILVKSQPPKAPRAIYVMESGNEIEVKPEAANA